MSLANAPGLERLQELPLPAPAVSYLPQTWGWLVLLALLLGLLVAWGWRAWHRWQRDRYRRQALARLEALTALLTDPSARLRALRELPELLKRVALSMPGGARAASLGGVDWQAWLQRSGAGGLPDDFSLHLATLAYAPDARLQAYTSAELNALLAHSRRWIESHHVAA